MSVEPCLVVLWRDNVAPLYIEFFDSAPGR